MMTEKNARKQKAKAMRNTWTCARPVTQIVPNKKTYNRKREKDRQVAEFYQQANIFIRGNTMSFGKE